MKLGDGNGERDRDVFVGADDDAHVAAGTLPALPRPVDVPAPVHLHVRMKVQVAGEFDDEVLACRADALDRPSRHRCVVVDTRELGEHGLERGDRPAGKSAVKGLRGTIDGVAFRHIS